MLPSSPSSTPPGKRLVSMRTPSDSCKTSRLCRWNMVPLIHPLRTYPCQSFGMRVRHTCSSRNSPGAAEVGAPMSRSSKDSAAVEQGEVLFSSSLPAAFQVQPHSRPFAPLFMQRGMAIWGGGMA